MSPKSKPKYLGTLNAIAVAEADAGRYMTAWAAVTPNEDLRCVLEFVAARETSHGDIFCRRIAELGFTLRPGDQAASDERCRRYGSADISDLEKVGPGGSGGGKDPFEDIECQLNEGLYDPLTALLMRWYIAEERDSGRMLDACYKAVRAAGSSRNGATISSADASSPGTDARAIMSCMTAGFDRLEKAIQRLAEAGAVARA